MYTLKGQKCGTVRFEPYEGGVITDEAVNRSSTITDNPIEGGGSVSDHVFRQPRTLQINGVVVGGVDAIEQLDQMWRTGDILSYTGRTRMDNLVMQNFSSTQNAGNKKGFEFSATLKQITIASAEYVAMGEEPMMSQQDTAALTAAQTSAPAASSGGGAAAAQMSKTRADGLKTTATASISASAYAKYVSSYNKKPAGSAGPKSRVTPSNTGRV